MQKKRIFTAGLSVITAVAMAALAVAVPVQAALSTNAAASNVIGQPNMTSGSINAGAGPGEATAQSFFWPREMTTDGTRLLVTDTYNNRIAIYNSVPTADNASMDVVIGQQNLTSNSENQGGSATDTALNDPSGAFFDGEKLFVTDAINNRVLIFNSIPTSNNAAADVVVGQPNMTSGSANQGGTAAANTLNSPNGVFSTGGKLFISDWGNNRVLIFNTIPTSNNASANVVIGQGDMTSVAANQGGSVGPSTIYGPSHMYFNGKKLFVADRDNNRVLIFNSIPTTNNASADVVIGQQDFTHNDADQGGATAANTLDAPREILPYGPKLLISDSDNSRVLVYNAIPTSNNASADVVIGQADMSGHEGNRGGAISANTLNYQRGILLNDSKLFVADYGNNRVLIYNSFGSQWTINKSKSRVLSGGEKIKVQKKKLEFSAKKTVYKKGWVRIFRDGHQVKKAKIKGSGNWSTNFKDGGSAVKDFVIKYYDSHNVLKQNSETYTLGINRGSLSAATLEKQALPEPTSVITDNNIKMEEFLVPVKKSSSN